MPAAEIRKLTMIAWLIAIVIMGLGEGARAWQGANWGTDDFMRLVQVKDLLDGQPWNDLTQYRLNPPGGTLMHWSRLVDAPIALATLALSPLLARDDAVAVAAMVLPPLYLLLFLLPFAAASRLMVGATRSPAALLIAFCGSVSVMQFAPGQVDHHGLQLGLLMVALAQLLLGLAHRQWRRAITLAGVPIGLSIWIGAETAPLIAAWFTALGLIWCRRGGDLARHGGGAALIAALVGLAALLTSTPPAAWLVPRCDTLALPPIAGMALAAAGLAILHLVGRRADRPASRLACAALCGGAVAATFVLLYPGCLGGYGSALAPVVEQQWMAHVSEARPIGELLTVAPLKAMAMLWTPAAGLAWCFWRLATARGRTRDLWLTITILLLCPTLLMLWQVRATSFAQMVALIPLTSLVTGLWQHMRAEPRWLGLALKVPVLFAFSVALWPTVEAVAGRLHREMPSAASVSPAEGCSNRRPIEALAGRPPERILSYIDLGPMLLFNTPHAVLGAPYHRDVAGLEGTIELFRSTDDKEIRRQLRERNIAWVATCPGVEERVTYRTERGDGLAERLVAGRVPAYLEPIRDPGQPAIRLYRVQR